ncbi:PREDICTED: T-cell surface antigen CD2 [Condylura cristata]|uniref:T-cell surface antigen CD2 n=1 Tax=Condylura cristata TaxID=143302 RepID=UPI000643DB7D|nr:PREDICTED: T-cell surface antigen CD2 [Condylura cristata]
MSVSYTIVASFFLMCFSPKGPGTEAVSGAKTETVWGALDRDFYLGSPSTRSDVDIRWYKNGTRIQFKEGSQTDGPYMVFKNATLKIKGLKRDHGGLYSVEIFGTDGVQIRENIYEVKVEEAVSKPNIIWDCQNRSLTCTLSNNSKVNLTLYKDRKYIQSILPNITYQWRESKNIFNCTARNNVSVEFDTLNTAICSGKGLDIYLIGSICGGGTLFLIFVVLLIVYISKRRKRNSQRNDEREGRVPGGTTKEGGQKPYQFPGSESPHPALLQPPPPPAHRSHSPGLRAPPPGLRAQQQQRRALPPQGAQVPQQKGPPLPRPRVCPKPPQGNAENM